MISYKEFDSNQLESVKQIYKDHFWSAYLNDDERLTKAFDQSLYIFGAFDQDKLVGFVRCVGDGQHVILVQDLIVSRDYQGQGIGKELLNQASLRYKEVRAFYIVTDHFDKASNAFYQALGYKPFIDKSCIGYMR